MNYIFDIGNVIVDYNPKEFLVGLFCNQKIINRLYDLIFLSPEWAKMDNGLLSQEQAFECFCAKEPGLRDNIELIRKNIYDLFTPKQDTIDLLPVIKEAGHGLYYLSNIHVEIRDYLLSEHDYFYLFDGGVFSCDVKMIKPSSGIYRYLLTRYDISADSCVFYDDMEENVIAAQKEGIQGVLFNGIDCVRI